MLIKPINKFALLSSDESDNDDDDDMMDNSTVVDSICYDCNSSDASITSNTTPTYAQILAKPYQAPVKTAVVVPTAPIRETAIVSSDEESEVRIMQRTRFLTRSWADYTDSEDEDDDESF